MADADPPPESATTLVCRRVDELPDPATVTMERLRYGLIVDDEDYYARGWVQINVVADEMPQAIDWLLVACRPATLLRVAIFDLDEPYTRKMLDVLRPMTGLTDLQLERFQIDTATVDEVLVPWVGELSSLELIPIVRLDGLTDEQCAAVLEAIPVEAPLQELHLSGVTGVEQTLHVVAGWLVADGSQLDEVNLHECTGLDDDAVETLAAALQRIGSVRQLWLGGNAEIGDRGARALAEVLMMGQTLQYLGLQECSIGKDGVRALLDAVKVNVGLGQLWLDGNPGFDDAAEAEITELLSESVREARWEQRRNAGRHTKSASKLQ